MVLLRWRLLAAMPAALFAMTVIGCGGPAPPPGCSIEGGGCSESVFGLQSACESNGHTWCAITYEDALACVAAGGEWTEPALAVGGPVYSGAGRHVGYTAEGGSETVDDGPLTLWVVNLLDVPILSLEGLDCSEELYYFDVPLSLGPEEHASVGGLYEGCWFFRANNDWDDPDMESRFDLVRESSDWTWAIGGPDGPPEDNDEAGNTGTCP